MTATLELSLLRAQLDRLLAHAELQLGPSVELRHDHHWLLEARDAFDLESTPRPTVGQLTDDLDELNAIAARPDGELVRWHDLAHLVGLLSALANDDRPR